MKKFPCSAVLCCIAAVPAIAQGGGAAAAGAAQTPQAAPTDPLSTFVKAQWGQITKNLIASVEQMPDANFSMKLGTTPDVRLAGRTRDLREFLFLLTRQRRSEPEYH